MSGLEVGTISSASNSSNWVPSSTTSKDDGINPEYEALLGVSVKSAKVLPSRLTTRLGTFKKVEISEVNATLTGQWYTVGVVVSKSQVKTAKTDAGSKFGVLTLYDMKKTTIALFCFGEVGFILRKSPLITHAPVLPISLYIPPSPPLLSTSSPIFPVTLFFVIGFSNIYG